MPYTPHMGNPNGTTSSNPSTPELQTSTMTETVSVTANTDTAANGTKIMRGSAMIVLAAVLALWVIERKVRGS